jgi:hypothetical protein
MYHIKQWKETTKIEYTSKVADSVCVMKDKNFSECRCKCTPKIEQLIISEIFLTPYQNSEAIFTQTYLPEVNNHIPLYRINPSLKKEEACISERLVTTHPIKKQLRARICS